MRRAVLVFTAGVAAFGAAAVAQSPASRSVASAEWRHYGGDAASSKYSAVDQITRANVNRLAVAWRWSTPDNEIVKTNPARPYGYQDTPLLVNGVLYTTTPLGVIAAIDPITGHTIWSYDPDTWKLGRPTNLGFTHRGSAFWTDGTRRRIITGTHDAQLISLDAETGKPDPEFGTGGRVRVTDGLPYVKPLENYAMNSAPLVVRNVIVTGANIVDRPMVKEQPRGDIFGFDARTGKKLWTFHSVPQKGEFGYDTWDEGSAEYTGNTNVWSLMTADDETGYVYLPFGTPTNDFYGGHRPGLPTYWRRTTKQAGCSMHRTSLPPVKLGIAAERAAHRVRDVARNRRRQRIDLVDIEVLQQAPAQRARQAHLAHLTIVQRHVDRHQLARPRRVVGLDHVALLGHQFGVVGLECLGQIIVRLRQFDHPAFHRIGTQGAGKPAPRCEVEKAAPQRLVEEHVFVSHGPF